MSRRFLGSLVGAAAAVALAAPAAPAATVDVRVVGPDGPLVQERVRTTRRPVVKDGENACRGTSAAGAMEVATGGRWRATWFRGLGYSLTALDGVEPAFPDYWTIWVNGRSAMAGLCDTELQDGDELLAFVCTGATEATGYSCANRPLALIAPRRAAGRALAVRVVTLADDGRRSPAADAVVRGGVRPVRADRRGVARVPLPAGGQVTLVATRAGDVAAAPVRCAVGGRAVRCGDGDASGPALSVLGIRDGQRFAADRAPRVLRGRAIDPSGARVQLQLTRRHAGRCTAYDGARERYVPCGRRGARWFDAGDRARWSYLLPQRLAPGRYVLAVRATDRNGNRSALTVRFAVRARAGAAAAGAAAATGRAAARAVAPRVTVTIRGRRRTLLRRRAVRARATTVRVGGKRCAVAGGTPLAALLAVRRAGGPAVTVTDYGACSRRAADGGGLFVARIGRERAVGAAGWVFVVNGRHATAGAADPSGPFGSGPLRRGDRVVWFWCRQAGRCDPS